MIKYIAVDPVLYEEAVSNHLALLRECFDQADYNEAYDILQTAIRFYGTKREEIQQMQKDYKA